MYFEQLHYQHNELINIDGEKFILYKSKISYIYFGWKKKSINMYTTLTICKQYHQNLQTAKKKVYEYITFYHLLYGLRQ